MTGDGPVATQDPDAFGIGRLFFLTSEAIVGVDLARETIVLWNPAAERVFGYSADEALGMPLVDLVPPSLRGDHLTGIRRFAAGGAPVLVGADAIVVPAVAKDGAARDISLSLTDVSVAGDRRFVLAVIRDVTAQLAAERDAAASTATMREFVTIASHDLRSPLSAVLGFARLLADSSDQLTPERRQTCIEAIERGARQASRLVDDLLTLSQITAAVLPIRPEPAAVGDIARQAVVDTGLDVTVEVADDVRALADPEHLRRILVNYLVNADHHGAPPVRVTAAVTGDTVEICVRDSGAGVPADFVDRLFTSFARADMSDRRGTGLGLSIVQGLAAANGGDAFYDRSEGPTFGVRLRAG